MGETSFDGVEGNGLFLICTMNLVSAAVEEKVFDGLWTCAAAPPDEVVFPFDFFLFGHQVGSKTNF